MEGYRDEKVDHRVVYLSCSDMQWVQCAPQCYSSEETIQHRVNSQVVVWKADKIESKFM
jgi:hypothetical protein